MRHGGAPMTREFEGGAREELRALVRQQPPCGGMVWYRSDEERSYLSAWLAAGDERSPRIVRDAPADSPGVDCEERAACTRCENVVRKRGPFGSGANGIMIILNMPSRITDFEKKFYAADADELLSKMMGAIGIDLAECYVTELVKCDPTGSASSAGALFDNCRAVLTRELEERAPRFVVVMGELAPLQKIIHRSRGILWYAIEHPVVLLKNPDLKKPAWNTLKVLRTKLAEPSAGR